MSQRGALVAGGNSRNFKGHTRAPMMFGCDLLYTVYVIECKTPDHYYIGLTRHFDDRIRMHICGVAARFTAAHGFKKVVSKEVYEWKEDAKNRERELVEQYIQRYGVENVAGAGWSQVLKGKVRGAQLQRRRWSRAY